MNIIQITSALAPEFGGPVRSIPPLCLELANLGNQVTLVYLDFGKSFNRIELPDHENLSYVGINVKYRFGLRPVLVPGYHSILMELAAEKDDLIFHDNGIWLPYSGQVLGVARKTGSAVITSTRGMLEPWAMNYGRSRKIVSWHLYQKRRLERNAILHATSEDEARNLRALSLTSPITVIPNGTIFPGMMEKRTVKSEKKTILFLSRIHPKKGLLNLVKAIEQLKPAGWEVVIAGYDEAGYQKTVESAVGDAGVDEYFRFKDRYCMLHEKFNTVIGFRHVEEFKKRFAPFFIARSKKDIDLANGADKKERKDCLFLVQLVH